MTNEERDQYELDPAFERDVVALLCTHKKFFDTVGPWLVPTRFPTKVAQNAVNAAILHYKEAFSAPASMSIVRQKLVEIRRSGKLEQKDINDVINYCEDAFDRGLPDPDQALSRLVALLKTELRREVVEEAILETKPGRGDFTKIMTQLGKVERIGQEIALYGEEIGRDSWAAISALRHAERCELGIRALDDALSGGINRGGLFCWLAETGAGKSMACSHTATHNFLQGMHVLYASLELPTGEVWARIHAAISGIKINALKAGQGIKEADQALQRYARSYGRIFVQEFTAYATTADDIIDWVRRQEDRVGKKCDLLIVDPMDRLAAPKEMSEYNAGRVIADGLRAFVHGEKIFGLTCSHVTRKKQGRDGRKLIGTSDAADSMHKMRIVDGVVSINFDEEANELLFYIAKHRTGDARLKVGPYRPDFAKGRLVWKEDEDTESDF